MCIANGSVSVAIVDPIFPATYNWTGPGGSSSMQTWTSLDPGWYTVTVTQAGCSTTDSIEVLLDSPPPIIDTLESTNTNCNPIGSASVLLVNPSVPAIYSWIGLGGLSSNTQTWSSLDAGWYTVTVTQAGCVESDSVEVLLDPDPVANFNFTPPLSNCQPVTYSFVNNSNATNYIWNFGNGEPPSIESSPTQIYLDEPFGNITVTLIVFNNDILCSDTIDTTIDLDVCDCTNPSALNFNPLANIDDGSCTPEVYAPNVFTPNSDAQNPTFFLSGKNIVSLELNILNRWGSVVFSQSSSDLVNNNPSWDGKIDGDLAKEGIYFYIYKATSISNQIVEGHGFLHLILDK